MSAIARTPLVKGLWTAALAAMLTLSGCSGGGGGDAPASSNYTIAVSADPTEGGSITGDGSYAADAEVTVTATPNTGYTFINWTENGSEVSTSASYLFGATADRTLIAHFSLNGYTITTDPGPGGSFDPTEVTVEHNGNASFTVTPDDGYSVTSVSAAGCSGSFDSATSIFTTGAVTGDCVVSATFSAGGGTTLYSIGASASPTAGGNVSGSGSYSEGSSVTLTASANTGYTFVNWTEGGAEVSTSASYTFSAAADRSLVANFTTNSYTIGASASPAAGGSVTGDGAYNHGTQVTLTASANTGYSFVNWTEGGTEVSTSASYTFGATADRTLVANFSVVSYTVSTNVGTGGAIDPIDAVVEHGKTTSFTLNPDTGYDIVSVTGCDGSLSGSTFTTGQVFADCEVVATFGRLLEMQSFTKTSEYTLAWSTIGAASCEISNDQNSDVVNLSADSAATGTALHSLPIEATFTLNCLGETGTTASLSASAIGTNPFPETVGYYGSTDSMGNSWVAIVNLTTPIDFTDMYDFNSQVDSYCAGLGYVGVAKTKSGYFSTHATYYLHSSYGITGVSAPSTSNQVTVTPGDVTYTNVYTNASHWDNSWGNVARASIGNNEGKNTATTITSPTSGENQMVLCQTDISFGNTTSLSQTISFSDPGPIRKVQGLDEVTFVNTASGGRGKGQITYVSSDPTVASVDETTGTVTLVALGTATITATKAADLFVEAQASYTLTVDSPQPPDLQSFTKTSDNTLSWTTGIGTLSCEITNDQNSEVFKVSAGNLTSGMMLHPLPVGATFTITCQGEDGTSASLSATTVGTNPFPQTMGYYGSANSMDNSWLAIVNLATPIEFTDMYDFNAQVDSYCAGLGYVGVAKTKSGYFSTHATYYLHSSYGITGVSAPSTSYQVTVTPGDVSYTNVYTNASHWDNSWGNVARATIGNNAAKNTATTIASPTSGENQMVLCQTDITFRNTGLFPQTISFSQPGPIRKVQGVDEATFVNAASGGLGKGQITYVSSDPTVATIDETTGAVTLIALGNTTITATKAADAFVEAQASYTLTVDSPQPIDLQSFTKTSDSSISWTTGATGTLSCEITNDQNSEVLKVSADSLTSGTALHPLPAGATFTITCQGEDGTSATQSVTTVGTNPFPETVGYYGSASSMDNSWAAIVNLTTPINFTDRIDFNSQVDSYCFGLGYVGAVKTKTGAFSVHDTYYLQSSDGIITGSGPSDKVTLIPGNATYTNVYTNRRNDNTTNGNVGRATIGDNASTIVQSIASPTSGENQMVLCQTDISFRNTTSFPQTISFAEPGPIRKVEGLDTSFVNTASGGLGKGAITYVSSNPAVATVNETTGTVTLVALGTTIITATKAADAFVEAQASYTLTVDSPQPISLKSFIKSTGNTLRWSTDYAVSCEITNDQNSDVITLTGNDMSKGNALHTLPAGAVFTLTCEGETGTTASTTVSTVTNLYPQTVGYYGFTSSKDNSWAAIVNLTTPIEFIDAADFNAQVDNYCAGLGYVGTVKTKSGDFSLNSAHYIQTSSGIIDVYVTSSSKVTYIPGDISFTNVYTQRSNSNAFPNVVRATIGDNTSIRTALNPASPTSGDSQMVLCQTDIPFRTSALLPQTISLAEPGPIRKVMGVDETTFVNAASGGKGNGVITYASSNPAVATVDENDGTITLIDLGSTTITATKAADAYFQEAQASYVLNYETPQNLDMQSFTKTGASTLAWSVKWAVSCDLTNDKNSVVTPIILDKQATGLASGRLLHGLPADTAFTLTCEGETGSIGSLTDTVGTNLFPEIMGYYGSAYTMDSSWVAIVNLTSPIEFADRVDFNTKVDSYCSGLGYIGAAKTKQGDFSVHDTSYFWEGNGLVYANSSPNRVTLLPTGTMFTNIYVNQIHDATSGWGTVVTATIGSGNYVIANGTVSTPAITTGTEQMVLCQTDLSWPETVLIAQTVSFNEPGPVFKTLGVDTSFNNAASGSTVSTPVTYVSSNPAIANVDAYGTVTLVSTGTTTITATVKPDFGFIEAQASYTLDVQ